MYLHVEATYYGCTNPECSIEPGNWFDEGYKGGNRIHPKEINVNNDCSWFEEKKMKCGKCDKPLKMYGNFPISAVYHNSYLVCNNCWKVLNREPVEDKVYCKNCKWLGINPNACTGGCTPVSWCKHPSNTEKKVVSYALWYDKLYMETRLQEPQEKNKDNNCPHFEEKES